MAPMLMTRRITLSISAVWAVFCLPLLGDQVPYYRDLLRTDWPVRVFIGNSLREGRLPQWYPYEGLGLPFIGNAEGLFRPFSLLYVLPFHTLGLIKVEIALCVLLGLWGFVALARRLGVSEPAAVLGAIAFAFSGYSLSIQDNLPYLYPYHLMPWVLWAAHGALVSPHWWRWAVALSLLWSQVLLGGDPLASVFLGAGIVAMIVAERRWRQSLPIVVAGALTAGLCMAWVVPAWGLFKESTRVGWAPDPSHMALHFGRLPELLLGSVWPDDDQAFALKRAIGGEDLWANSLFLGATVLLLAALAVFRSRRATVWGLTGALFLWAATGPAGGLHTVLRAVFPLLDLFRYPEKYVSMAVLTLSLTAAFGADLVSQTPWAELRPRLVRTCWIAALFVSMVLIALLALPASFNLKDGRDLAVLWGLGAVFTGSVWATSVFVLRQGSTRPALAWFAPALVFAELLVASDHARLLIPREVVSGMPPFCRAAITAGATLGHMRVWTQVSHFPAFRSGVDGASWVFKTLNLLEPDVSSLCNLEAIGTPNLSGTSARLWRALHQLDRERLAALFNAGVYVVDAEGEVAGRGVILERGDRYAVVRPAQPPRPRAYDAMVRWVPDAPSALASLATLPEGVATLEGPPGALTGSAQGRVEVVSYAAGNVELELELPDLRAVILNDLYAPGWTARLDGEAVPLFRANYLAMGVLSPPGRHHLQFTFVAPGLELGLRLTGLSLVACLALIFAELRRQQRPGR